VPPYINIYPIFAISTTAVISIRSSDLLYVLCIESIKTTLLFTIPREHSQSWWWPKTFVQYCTCKNVNDQPC